MHPGFKIFILCMLPVLFPGRTNAQVNEVDPVHFQTDRDPVLGQLMQDYRDSKITNTDFLRQADTLVPVFSNSSELPALLKIYKEIAWTGTQYQESRPRYFLYMAMHHLNYRDLGSAIFYYRKAFESATDSTPVKQLLSPFIGLTNINLEFHNLEQARIEYQKIAPYLSYVFRYLDLREIRPEELARISILLANGHRIYAGLNDPERTRDCYYKLRKVFLLTHNTAWQDRYATAQAAKHARFIANKYFLARFGFHQSRNDPERALQDLHAALSVLSAGTTPDEKDVQLYIYSLLIRFHLSAHHTDSAGYYITLFDKTRSLSPGTRMMKHNEEQQYFLLAFYADLYEQAGNAPMALFYLRKAGAMQDSIYERIMTDYNNSLYAKTQVAYDKEQLIEAGIVQEKTRRVNLVLEGLIGLGLIAGVLFIYWYRMKQKQRFVQSKLDMARNIHDEIGPMLLYAKMLLRSEARKEGRKAGHSELEVHISKTLESVRHLAHELKSEQQYTLGSLVKRLQEQLKKNEKINKIRFVLDVKPTHLPLSTYQYHHLVNIFSELISNTIKHASCRVIRVRMIIREGVFEFEYSDDGKGFSGTDVANEGIGLQNIGERLTQLKGRMQMENNFPQGYRILMYIPSS